MIGVAVCIAGMHRSGVSMVGDLLEHRGLQVGGEGRRFAQLNDDLLDHLGAGWDLPPKAPSGWAHDDGLRPLRARAEELVSECAAHAVWGWKDPGSSLTLRFWTSVLPELKTVICLRNPLEVAVSLQGTHGVSRALSLKLWWTYYRRLLTGTRTERRIVTHFDAYFHHADNAMERVLEFLGVAVPGAPNGSRLPSARPDLRHAAFTINDLRDADIAPELVDLYLDLCSEAGWFDDVPSAAETAREAVAGLDVRDLGQHDGTLGGAISDLNRRLDEVHLDFTDLATRIAPPASSGTEPSRNGTAPDDPVERARRYQELVARVRDVVVRTVPPSAPVLVVSKGDGALLQFDGRAGWHFPQTETGGYAGHHPADSVDAIAQLESARAKGAAYLVFPDTAAWWLEYYGDFRRHLEQHYELATREDGTCVVFDLGQTKSSEPAIMDPPAFRERAIQIREIVEAVLPAAATVVVVTEEDEALRDLGHELGWRFPLSADGSPSVVPDGIDVRAQVDAMRADGAQYLLLPRAASSSGDVYRQLRRCLERGHRLVVEQHYFCSIYELTAPAGRRRRPRLQRRSHA